MIGTVHGFDTREVSCLRRHATAGLHAAFSAMVKAWMDRQCEGTIGGISTPALSQAGVEILFLTWLWVYHLWFPCLSHKLQF